MARLSLADLQPHQCRKEAQIVNHFLWDCRREVVVFDSQFRNPDSLVGKHRPCQQEGGDSKSLTIGLSQERRSLSTSPVQIRTPAPSESGSAAFVASHLARKCKPRSARPNVGPALHAGPAAVYINGEVAAPQGG